MKVTNPAFAPSAWCETSKRVNETVGKAIDSFQSIFNTKGSCELCGEIAAHQCSACKGVQYCSAECQAQDWKGHEAECAAIRSNTPWTAALTSVHQRHIDRFGDVEALLKVPEPVEGRFGRGGGGGRGFGGPGRVVGPGRGIIPARRYYGPGWGRWGAGLFRTALGYPWWYSIPPYYYAQGIPYPGYGVPPYPPGYVYP